MRVLHLSPSLSRTAGGIFEIERSLARELSSLGVDNEAYGLLDDQWPEDQHSWSPVRAEVFSTIGPRAFGYAPGLRRVLKSSPHDLLHLHALWMYPSFAARGWNRRHAKPYMVTPNGMLEPWALSNSAWKKRLAGILYENRMLRSAACLQANTEKEMRDFRAYGLKNPVCVIPNGIELPIDQPETKNQRPEKKILLFLGRLHPKKGLENALRAWAKIWELGAGDGSQEEWQFVIAGWDQSGHEADLKRLCKELGLAYAETPASEFLNLTPDSCPLKSVSFVGPAFGATKDKLLRRASAFILASFSEGLPMSVLEAWSYRLPVLMTDECNLPEGFAADAAIRICTDTESIAVGMRLLLRSPISDLQSLGDNGRQLVSERFTWPMVASQMKEVYEWILEGGAKPESVITRL